MSRSLVIALGVIALALGATLWGATFFWEGLGTRLSGHGWFAYVLGGVLTLALSAGLFLLSFHSARHGYDEAQPPGDDPHA